MSAPPCDPRRGAPVGSALVAAVAVLAITSLALSAAGLEWPVPPAFTAAEVRLRLDPNTASAAELALLPRIGPTLAGNIVAYREAVGGRPAFRCAADLDRVARIGPATVAALSPYLRFAQEAAQQETPRGSP